MALFSLSATCLLPPASVAAPDNKAIRSLVVARLVAQRRFAPRSLWLPTNWRAALTTTMRMITRVHDGSANGWTAPQVTRTPGFTYAPVLMVDIANLANCGRAEDMHSTLLA